MATPPRVPFVIHCFSPFRTYSSVSGSYSAVVDISAGFDPACGSERQNIPTGRPSAAISGSQRSRWVSLPNSAIQEVARQWTDSAVATARWPYASSSLTTA